VNELHLFAGAGGGILAGHLLGHRCVCAVECEPYAQAVLVARQNDGSLPPFPIWDDVRTFDGRPWHGIVDLVAGGFPCTDISTAGAGAGIDGEQSGLWREMARIVREVRPRYVFVENSPALTSRGLGRVLGDLAALGFDARWGVLGADDCGGIHRRERIWIIANAAGLGRNETPDSAGANRSPGQERTRGAAGGLGVIGRGNTAWAARFPMSRLARITDGVAHRVERTHAIGNGQVSRVAARAWQLLTTDQIRPEGTP
jgi:DNA (cytosine-5)-methyltransferase 1